MTPKTVLYVEDSAVDAFFMTRVFQMLGCSSCLRVVGNGEDAVGYLAGTGVFNDRQEFPLPSLVLLDLNLPGKQGLEVLDWIRKHPQYQSLPVVIFTSSALESDRHRAAYLGVSGYITKPNDMTNLPRLISPLLNRFLDVEAPVEPVPTIAGL